MGVQHRKLARRHVEQSVLLMSIEGALIGQCTMLDVSSGGARLKLPADIVVPDLFTLFLSKLDGRLKRQCIVAWLKDKSIGVRFVTAEDFVSAIVTSA